MYNKFKVGDKVRVIGSCKLKKCERAFCLFLNKVGIIQYISDRITVSDFDSTGLYCSSFEKINLKLASEVNKKVTGFVNFINKIEGKNV